MDNSTPDQGIGKTCKICGKSPQEGVVFGVRKVSTENGPSFYEKLTCKFCEAKSARQRRQDSPEKFAENKQKHHERHHGTIEYHVTEKIATWRKASTIPSDLTVGYLVELYNQQDGYCYYSGEKMVFGWVDGKVHHNSLSLDKLDPNNGYIKGNVVWCTYLINTMKQNMTEQQFYDAINKVVQTTYGVPMISDITIKDKLRKISMDAKLGIDLVKTIEKECAEEAKKGKYKHRMYFAEPPQGIKPFYASLGPANQALWNEINHPRHRANGMTTEEFTEQVLIDLRIVTGLEIILVPYPRPNPDGSGTTQYSENFGAYGHGASVVLDISWSFYQHEIVI